MSNTSGRIRTVPNPVLAFLQSIVSEVAEEKKSEHPLKDDKVNEIAQKIASLHEKGNILPLSDLKNDNAKQPTLLPSFRNDWKFGDKIIDLTKNLEHDIGGDLEKVYDKILEHLGIRPFSEDDPGWSQVAYEHLRYVAERKPVIYRDWEQEGKNNINYSVIAHEIPDDATIGLIADWGTGTGDSAYVLEDMMQRNVDVIIHLGDIYYAGTPYECKKVKEIINKVTGDTIPVYMIPGNHDYYSFGYGFYPLIDKLNEKFDNSYKQDASYFCLRTQSKSWQFLGMDTGINDYYKFWDYTVLGEDYLTSPEIKESELVWHLDKLKNFTGKTILLSHHQLFSGNTKVNGSKSTQKDYPFVNNRLVDDFKDYTDNIAAWFWGHEHNLVIFDDPQQGYKKGRLIGCSGYEEMEKEDPYKQQQNAPAMNLNYKLDIENNFYNHGYAVITLNDNDATAEYYQVPSWAEGKRPKNITKYPPIYTESLS